MERRSGNPRGVTPDGRKIRELREARGLTAVQLARAVGRNVDRIRKAERLNDRISAVTASRIAITLGVSRDEILAGDDHEPEAIAS